MQKQTSIKATIISILLVANSAWLLVLALTFLYALAEELFFLPGEWVEEASLTGLLAGICSMLLIVYVLWLAVLALLGLSALVENKANALQWRHIWPTAGLWELAFLLLMLAFLGACMPGGHWALAALSGLGGLAMSYMAARCYRRFCHR
ncbi:MAG: hypothetical protein E7032_07975 [Akkermansiaceae bacterium]|nr:hypothetical protein [Akkermansiaceae bacterium]